MPGGKQSAAEVASRAIAALARGQRTIVPYFGGWFASILVRFLPVNMITALIEKGRDQTKALQGWTAANENDRRKEFVP